MFLVRSIFWLVVAYMIIKPGVDFAGAAAMSNQAMTAGQQMVADQVAGIDCDTLQCIGGKAVLSAALKPSPATMPIPAPAPQPAIPIPRPRPAR